MKVFFLKIKGTSCPLKADLEGVESINEETAITVGNFDGLHVGHKYLIDTLVHNARARGLKSLVITFCPHPLKILAPNLLRCELSDIEEKIEVLGETPVDYLCVVGFNESFSKISAREFLKNILVERLGCRFLLVGYDWRFGHRREGEIELAREVGEELGFEVELAKPFRLNGHIVSSTLIRRLLSEGKLEEAKNYIGCSYWVKREVVKGDGRGSKIGFPTANLDGTENLCLKEGVYVVKVDGVGIGVANYGYRPTFDGKRKVLEIHFPGREVSLIGKKIRVEFCRYLRPEKKFANIEELTSQIKRDIQEALRGGC